MLILVGVTVNVALNGGLFDTAQKAGKQTELETDRELLTGAVLGALAEDSVTVDFEKLDKNLPNGFTGESGTYTSSNGNIFTVLSNGEIYAEGEEPPIELPEGWNESTIGDIIVATIEGKEYKVPIPKGFVASKATGENTLEKGLVIYEGTEEVNDSNVETAKTSRNQFVWIPVANAETYVEDDLEPLTGTDSNSNAPYDSQQTLNYYYGEGFFNYTEDFNYAQDKTNIEESIKKYKGFYVGRYETTIDENGTIGSMKNEPILTSDKTIAQTNNKLVRWYGLYKVQKDMYVNNPSVGSLMISSKQWDEIMTYTGYGDATRPLDTYTTKPDLSGSVYTTDENKYDVSKNIYDLAGNISDWTVIGYRNSSRITRGGSYNTRFEASCMGGTEMTYLGYDGDPSISSSDTR